MAPNRIRRPASSNPATGGIKGPPRRHGHRTYFSLPKSPGIWRGQRVVKCSGCDPTGPTPTLWIRPGRTPARERITLSG